MCKINKIYYLLFSIFISTFFFFFFVKENIENDQYTPSVTNTGSNLLANDVMPHSVASMTQSTIPIEVIVKNWLK